jgi:hypothetical protein
VKTNSDVCPSYAQTFIQTISLSLSYTHFSRICLQARNEAGNVLKYAKLNERTNHPILVFVGSNCSLHALQAKLPVG